MLIAMLGSLAPNDFLSKLHDAVGNGFADAGKAPQLRAADDIAEGCHQSAQAFGDADVGLGLTGIAAFERGAPADLQQEVGDSRCIHWPWQ